MTDLLLGIGWLTILIAGLGGCILARKLGVKTKWIRDGLHVGVGVWVLGWSLWTQWTIPLLITASALLMVLSAPGLARFSRPVSRLMESLASGDEGWSGIMLYVAAYFLLTLAASLGQAGPAGGAALALSLGDGLGGLAGREFGRMKYRMPWAKPKSLEGTLVVALGAGLGVGLGMYAGNGVVPGMSILVVTGLAAAIAEAVAPRASDNLLVPAVVLLLLNLPL